MRDIRGLIFVGIVTFSCNRAVQNQDEQAPIPNDRYSQNDIRQEAHGWSLLPEKDAPASRYRPVVLQKQSKVIVFGGYGDDGERSDGGIYNLDTNVWTNILSHRQNRSMNSVGLAGDYVVIWGGDNRDNWRSVSGLKYKLGSNQWDAVSTENAPSGRYLTPAFSLGDKLLIWGGHPNCDIVDGRIYDPARDVWQSVAAAPAGVTAGCDNVFFTGAKLVVWGHYTEDHGSPFSDGAIYDPATNSWDTIATDGQPSEREFALLMANDKFIAVWGGRTRYQSGVEQKALRDGGIYEIASRTWRSISDDSGQVPGGAQPTGTFLTEDRVFIWGGSAFGFSPTNLGGILNLHLGTWDLVSSDNAPKARSSHYLSAIDDNHVLVFGGNDGPQSLFDGSIYDAEANQWSSVDGIPDVAPRGSAAMRWTGREYRSFFVWGGNKIEQGQSILVPGGGLWRP